MEKKLALATPPLPLGDLVRYAIECCRDYLGLSFENRPEAAETFDIFRVTLQAVAEAGNKEAVNEAIFGLVTWCLGQVQGSPAQLPRMDPAPNMFAPTRAAVEARLREYRQWVAWVNQLMLPLQGEKDELDDLQQHEMERERYEQLQKYISELAQLVAPFEEDIARIEHYLASLSVIERGLSRDCFDVVFPAIPEMESPPAAPDEPDEPAPVVARAPRRVVPVSPERVHSLIELSEGHGILPIEIMAFSLFDLFGPWNAAVGGRHRGAKRALETAFDLGILQSYGWAGPEAMLKGMHWKGGDGTRGFLSYHGSPSGGLGTFTRTDKPLPWNARSLFTDSESAEFIQAMKERSQRAEQKP